MKICDWCGREDNTASVFCSACGSELVIRNETPADLPPIAESTMSKRPRVLNARSATIIWASALGASFVWAFIRAALEIAIARAYNIQNGEQVPGLLRDVVCVMAALTPVLAGVGMVLTARALVPEHLKDATRSGACWVGGTRAAMAKGLLIGLIIGVCLHSANVFLRAHVFHAHITYDDLDRLDRMAYVAGLPRTLWVLTGVLFSPVSEELLYRGVLYGGYHKSFGPIWATVLTTSVFLLVHLPAVIRFVPNIAAFAALALTALWFRLRTNSIGPAIAIHMGYNAVIAFTVVVRP